jgi:hypothetical protein
MASALMPAALVGGGDSGDGWNGGGRWLGGGSTGGDNDRWGDAFLAVLLGGASTKLLGAVALLLSASMAVGTPQGKAVAAASATVAARGASASRSPTRAVASSKGSGGCSARSSLCLSLPDPAAPGSRAASKQQKRGSSKGLPGPAAVTAPQLPAGAIVYAVVELSSAERRMASNRQLHMRETLRMH